jgi:hypothetical protein
MAARDTVFRPERGAISLISSTENRSNRQRRCASVAAGKAVVLRHDRQTGSR